MNELINPYIIKFGDILLFDNIDNYVNELGLPSKVSQNKNDIEIANNNELKSLLIQSKEDQITELLFEGVEVWAFSNLGVLPMKIDLRKLKKEIHYKDKVWDSNYSINDLKKDFPNTLSNQPNTPISFFSMSTGEFSDSHQSKILYRKTKDNPDATPLVEFTFENDKLIYIFFANF